MNTLARLESLVGKRGLLPIRCGTQYFEVEFTFLSVMPGLELPMETDAYGFQEAITQNQFTVGFEPGTLIDGRSAREISGRSVSRIMDCFQGNRQ